VAKIQHLQKPPIREALIDLQFADADIGSDQLESVANALLNAGCTKKELFATEAEFGPDGEVGGQGLVLRRQISAFDGYAIVNASESVILQVRSDRVTASHIGAYDRWEDLVADADRALQAHAAVSRAQRIKRVAARFINHVPVPTGAGDDLANLLTAPPIHPIEVGPCMRREFASRQVLEHVEGGLTAILAVATAQTPEGERALVIDVDVFKMGESPAIMERLRPDLDAIRLVKNRLFFGSLTEDALEQCR